MKKNKHDHKGTKALKLSIFFTLMLAPFLAVLFKCAYVTFNKNAKDSYSNYSYTLEETINVTNFNDLVDNTNAFLIINYSSDYDNTDRNSYEVYFNNLTINNNTYNTGYFKLGYKAGENLGNFLQIFDLNNSRVAWFNTSDIVGSYQFFYLYSRQPSSYYNQNNMYGCSISYFVLQQQQGTLDNSFYYAIDEAMESPYFAWARTSALYTATSGLTNGMGITTQAIPTLIVYWLILTAIYIIIDIVIESFTYLTHCIMNRFD